MTIVKSMIKDAFVLRIPMTTEGKVSTILIFKGDGSRKMPHKLIMKYAKDYGDRILGAFPDDTPLKYGDIPALIGRYARFQPLTVVEEGESVTVVTTGVIRNVVDTKDFAILD